MILQRITDASARSDNAGVHYGRPPDTPQQIIEALRKEHGIRSVRQLAIDAGISQSALSRYLSGKADTMETASFLALAKLFRVTLSELLGEVPRSSRVEAQEAARLVQSMDDRTLRQWLRLGAALIRDDEAPGSS